MFIIMANVDDRSFTLLDYFDGEYTAYTKEYQEGSVDLGFCYMSSKADSVIGESIMVENIEIANVINDLKMKVINTECLDNGTIVIYGYTNKISDSVEVGNKKINVQIAHNDSYSIIGWPLILGSF